MAAFYHHDFGFHLLLQFVHLSITSSSSSSSEEENIALLCLGHYYSCKERAVSGGEADHELPHFIICLDDVVLVIDLHVQCCWLLFFSNICTLLVIIIIIIITVAFVCKGGTDS